MHINASKEIILEEYKKKYELEEMPSSCVTRPLAAAPVAAPPPARLACPEKFGKQVRRLLDERSAAAASTDDTCMGGGENRPAEADPPPHPYTFVDASFYIKLKATIEVIFFRVLIY